MPQYKLTYFDARGSVESCRLILAYVGVEYDDVRIPIGKLTPEKKESLRLKFGYLPSLEFDGQVFTQSLPIARYFAQKFGLAGKDEYESLRIDESIYIISDYICKWTPLHYKSFTEFQREEIREKLLNVFNVQVMDYYDKLLKKNQAAGNLWLVGNTLSIADIYFAYVTSDFEMSLIKTDILKDYPVLQELRTRVLEQPNIKEYIANRPKTRF